MSTMKLVLWPDQILRDKAVPIEPRPDASALAADMVDTMYSANGLGLSAPQVGRGLRLIVIDTTPVKPIPADAPPSPVETGSYIMLNPEIVARSERTATFTEGCLSLPSIQGDVVRSYGVRVRYQDIKGAWYTLEAENILADAVQHEIDHLDGIVFVDRIGAVTRGLARQKMEKLKRNLAKFEKRRAEELRRTTAAAAAKISAAKAEAERGARVAGAP